MRRAWQGSAHSVVCDPFARTTAENAFRIAELARASAARDVVVVTSGWHARRARLLFRAALRASGVRVEVVPARDGLPVRPVLEELSRWPLAPFALALARRSTTV
jgi:uncharacterized SAM-binding protein YcdF (DUF218 family)